MAMAIILIGSGFSQDLFIKNHQVTAGVVFRGNEALVLPEVLQQELGIDFKVDPANLTVTAGEKTLPVKAVKANGKIYIPMSKLAPQVGYRYEYNSELQTADFYRVQIYKAEEKPASSTASASTSPEESKDKNPGRENPSEPPDKAHPSSPIKWTYVFRDAVESAQDNFCKLLIFFYDQNDNDSRLLDYACNNPALGPLTQNLVAVKVPLNSPEAQEFHIKKPILVLLYSTLEPIGVLEAPATPEQVYNFFETFLKEEK